MAKKQRDEGGGSGEWLNTYADLVTLLLTFFIMLFSMSTLQQEAFDQLVEGLKGPPGTESSVDSPSDSNTCAGGEPGGLVRVPFRLYRGQQYAGPCRGQPVG